MSSKEKPTSSSLLLDKEQQKRRTILYSRRVKMEQLKNDNFPHFSGTRGPRSFLKYIDDSEKTVNGYVLSREAQGKESWQSNTLDNITLAKMRAIAAGVGLKVPNMKFTARNNKGLVSKIRGLILEQITKKTFTDSNPSMQAFLEVWQLLAHGVLFEYEGYKTGGAKVKKVKSFNSITGEVTVKEEYIKLDGKPLTVILNPQEFFWWDMHVRDIQEQPHLMWVQHYTKKEMELEFSKFPNYKYVKDKRTTASSPLLTATTYFDKWSRRVDMEDDYEVIRFYSKEDDCYEIWINGIPMLLAPLLWGEKEKEYPFSKTIAQPFANTNFFVGMSFPGILEGYHDLKNSILNTLVDKLYRSMSPRKLIGLQNKDLFDIENSVVQMDDKLYVPDINAVKLEPVAGIAQGELAMMQLVDRGLDSISVDKSQQGMAQGGGRTARESVIANQRAQELKGSLYLALEDLWLQKTKLRIQVILTHYIKDISVQENRGGQIISINDFVFGNGEKGVLDIHVAKNKNYLLPIAEIQAREQASPFEVYKLVSITVDYLDNWKYDTQIIVPSYHNNEKIEKDAEVMEKIERIITLNPELYAANKDKFTDEVLGLYGESLNEYETPAPPETPPAGGESLLGLGGQEDQSTKPLPAMPTSDATV